MDGCDFRRTSKRRTHMHGVVSLETALLVACLVFTVFAGIRSVTYKVDDVLRYAAQPLRGGGSEGTSIGGVDSSSSPPPPPDPTPYDGDT
jgi:hypothetical protein